MKRDELLVHVFLIFCGDDILEFAFLEIYCCFTDDALDATTTIIYIKRLLLNPRCRDVESHIDPAFKLFRHVKLKPLLSYVINIYDINNIL